MAQPIWVTDAGDLGTYPTDSNLNIKLVAQPAYPSTNIAYSLVSGYFPEPIKNTQIRIDPLGGTITGTPKNIPQQITYTFTIRAIDNYNNIADRTFSFTLVGANSPKIITAPGEIISTMDSVYINKQIEFTNPITINFISMILTSGSLPPGLQLLENGRIVGYPKPPTLLNGSPTTVAYTFTAQLVSDLGSDTATYSITVANQRLTQPLNGRRPVMLNQAPLTYPINTSDSLYNYYTIDGVLPDFVTGSYFSFKAIGHDFDGSDIRYRYFSLPPGLSGDILTGWITGYPTLPAKGIVKYKFEVLVEKANNPNVNSGNKEFTLTVVNGVVQDLSWITPSDLGNINNGEISTLSIKANSTQTLNYRIHSGHLPLNLKLLPNGEIIGRVAEQPTSTFIKTGTEIYYIFEIMAYSPQYPLLQTIREFTLKLVFTHDVPLENVYIKALCNIKGRKVIQSLLTDESIIPTELLYRPADPYFGKAIDVRYIHAYGLNSTYTEKYIEAMQNHYERKIVLGEIKTALVRDENFVSMYEIVYSEIVDDLVNNNGKSIPSEIIWPRNIPLNQGTSSINNTTVNISQTNIKTSLALQTARYLNPESLPNMRSELVTNIGQGEELSVLPKWMTSQQTDGNVIGYRPVWIICYTLPGYAEAIRHNIIHHWPHRLNEIDFTIDRYIIDKSYSYNYNNRLLTPSWQELPSANPVPNPLDSQDVTVTFPKKTILPNN
jgi:hypothetical protein